MTPSPGVICPVSAILQSQPSTARVTPTSGQHSTQQNIEKPVIKPNLDDSDLLSILLTLLYLIRMCSTHQGKVEVPVSSFPALLQGQHELNPVQRFPLIKVYSRTNPGLQLPSIVHKAEYQDNNQVHHLTHSIIRMCPPPRECRVSCSTPSQGDYQRHIQCDESLHKRDHPTP